MSTTQTILLAAIAGFTIFLGLPLGRVPFASQRSRAFLNALSTGSVAWPRMSTSRNTRMPAERA